tara:strand:+ start:1100 stop:1699 length:600 start_codon:yes stop_codon:yes gene_type:complete
MDISWLGNKSFMISDEIISVVVNPNDSILSSSEINENTVIISTNSNDSLSSDLPIVDSPGEYEVNNVSIIGIANAIVKPDEKMITTCYKLESRGLSVVIIGDIGTPFDSETLSVLSSSHAVLFSPDNNNIDSEILANTIRSLETRKILISGYDKDSKKSSSGLESINKVLGIKEFEPKNKASFNISNIGDSQEIIILEN